MKSIIIPLILVAATMIMLIMSNVVTAAAYEGIQLCLKVVIPSLFPLFVICTYINATLPSLKIGMLRHIGKFCRIPEGTEPILLIGYLGGYPIGAQCIAQNYKNNTLSRIEAERMLGFCNNAGPAFIFGMLSNCFSSKYILWVLWLIQILSSILTARLIPCGVNTNRKRNISSELISIPQAVQQSIRSITSVCGWVVIFKIIVNIISNYLICAPQWVVIPISGILELVNGCTKLSSVSDTGLRFVLASAFLSFGGICVHMQTFSVTDGLHKKQYFIGKITQTAISISLSLLIQFVIFPIGSQFTPSFFVICVICCPIILLLFTFFRKSSRFSAPIVIQ